MLIAFIIESASDDPSKYYVPLSDKDNYYTFNKFS